MILSLPNVSFSGLRPPVWDRVEFYTGLQWGAGIVFTYGTTIYSEKLPLTDDVVAHERIHARQQLVYGSPDAFLERYFTDRAFRESMELEAYRVQWLYAKAYMLPLAIDRRRYLDRLVEKFLLDLGTGPGGLYEEPMTPKKAAKLIQKTGA